MKVRVADIINGVAVIQSWGRFTSTPVFGFTMARVIRAAEPILASYDEQRVKLLKQYGKPPASPGGDYTFETIEKREECGRAIAEVAAEEVDLPGVEPLSAKLLEAETTRTIGFMPTMGELIAVAWLFTTD